MNEFDDPFDLYRHSAASGRYDDEGREIRVLGRPILAWNPPMNNLSVPNNYRLHPLVAGRYFYTLPNDVINAVIAQVSEESFDADLLSMERQLSTINGDHTRNVGSWQDEAISYREFRSLPVKPFPDEMVRRVGMDPVAVSHSLRIYEERDLVPLEKFARAYCGWLMTNRQFLDERDELLSRHAETVGRWGTQHATFLSTDYGSRILPETDPSADPLRRNHNCVIGNLISSTHN